VIDLIALTRDRESSGVDGLTRETRLARVGRACLGGALLALLLLSPALARADRPEGVGADPGVLRAALSHHVLRTTEGRKLPLASLHGEVVVINFWASWCQPCRSELPALDALNARMAGRGARVLAVSIDQDPRNVERFVKTHHLSLPVFHDGPDGLAKALDLQHIPFTIVLDRDGAVAYTSSGADRASLDALATRTDALIAAKPYLSNRTVGDQP